MRFFTLLLSLFWVAPAVAQDSPVSPTEHPLYSIQQGDVVMGNPQAPVVIIEYSSLTCPHCASFHTQILPALKAEFIDSGKVALAARPFPLNEPALQASKVVACAPADRQNKFLEVFFKLQEKWAFNADYLEHLKQIAQVGGMGAAQVDACLTDTNAETAILLKRKAATEELYVQSTPTFFINGEKLVGTGSVERFREVILRKLGQ